MTLTFNDLLDLPQERVPVGILAQPAEKTADPRLLVHPFLRLWRDPWIKRAQLVLRESQDVGDLLQNFGDGPPTIRFNVCYERRLDSDLGGANR
jgi:hypothetical protein